MTNHIPARQVVVNIETTGLNATGGDRIIEIAAVEMIDHRASGRHLHRYINPDRQIDDAAIAVHGISLEMLLDKPRFSEVADEFTSFVRGAELIAHNVPFDVGFIDHEFSRLAFNPVATLCPSVIDTLAIARKLRPRQPNTISALCTAYGVNESRRNLHGALLDAYLLSEVYLALTPRLTH